MFAPSATQMQPFFTSVSASSPLTSFWVAQGRAMSHLTPHGRLPSWYSAAVLLRVLLDAAALDVLQLHDERQLLGVDALRVVDGAVGVGEGDALAAELVDLLDRVLGDVAGAGDRDGLALERIAARGQLLLREVDRAVARRLGTDEAAAPVEALAGQDAGELVAEPLVLPDT